MNWTQVVKRCFIADAVLYTSHARREMKGEEFGEIKDEEIFESILTCEVVEEYLDDTPYPSVLLFGMTRKKRPLHIVCAYYAEEDQAIIITVYHPDPHRWDDYRRRRK